MAASNLCEICERNRQLRDGLCGACTLEGLRKAQAEQDPNLEAYRELVRRVVSVPAALAGVGELA